MDYGTLKTTIASYLHRDDLTATIPTFIQLGQARMSHDLDLMAMQTTDSLTVTASVKEVTLPTDLISLKSVRIPYDSGFRTLQQTSLVGNTQVLEQYDGATAAPRYYARYGSIIELTPTPETATTLEIVYKKRFTEFSADVDTDEVLTSYPNIYIYASMLEASPFIMDDKRAVMWKAYYDDEVMKLNALNDDSEWSGAPLQINPSLGVDTP